MNKTKVYYNSACPVCNAGVKYQREKLGSRDDVEWIDVHADNDAVCDIGAELEFVRERLHVVDERGQVKVGSEAFALLWSKSPDQAALARIVSSRGLRHLSRWLYNGFARLLYGWNRLTRRW
jgi:predicted DCC family thiol-disulfide oxidoreductase YuxK